MPSIEYDVDPRQVILPAEVLNGSVLERADTQTVFVIGETSLAGAHGAHNISTLEIPILNALGLGRDQRLGRAALLESVAAPEFAQGTFARALHGLVAKLDGITGADTTNRSLVSIEGSGKHTTYRLSDRLLFADGADRVDWLIGQARRESVGMDGVREPVARFPARGMREQVFDSLLHEYSGRPLIATRVAELLQGRMYGVTENMGVRLIKYPRLDEQHERELLLSVEKGMLAYTGLSGGPEAQDAGAIEGAVLSFNELVFHCQYIAFAAAKRFSRSAPFDTLYQEANLEIMRSLKQYELRPPELGLRVTNYVSLAVTRQLQRVLAEESGVVRIAHGAIGALTNLKQWENDFAATNNRWPAASEIEQGLGISKARLRELRLLGRLTPSSIAGTGQTVEVGVESIRHNDPAFDQALVDKWTVREPLERLMASPAITDAQKVMLSLIYGVHFPQLAGLTVQNFTYPFVSDYLPVPDEGIMTPTAAGKILGMNMSAVSAMHNRALTKARDYLSELGFTSLADVYETGEEVVR